MTMTTTPPVPNIIQLIGSVMAEVTHVGKDGWNPGQKFKFRGIDAVVNAVGPALRKAGVVPTPVLETATYRDILTGGNRTPMQQCTVQVRYQFWGPAGDHLDVVVPGEAFDSGDKGTAKAMSVAYRIALLQLLALPTDEPDPDVVSYERAPHTVTDQAWLAAVRQRIDTAVDTAVLNRIGAEIGQRSDAGHLTAEDGLALRGLFDARWAQLQAEGSQVPVDDEWSSPSPAEPPPAAPPAQEPQRVDSPGYVAPNLSPPQSRLMHALFKKLPAPIVSSELRVEYCERVLGYELKPLDGLKTTNSLTPDEASSVITALKNAVEQAERTAAAIGKLIDDCTDLRELQRIGQDLGRERDQGTITQQQASSLTDRWLVKQDELRAAKQTQGAAA